MRNNVGQVAPWSVYPAVPAQNLHHTAGFALEVHVVAAREDVLAMGADQDSTRPDLTVITAQVAPNLEGCIHRSPP